MLRQVATIGGFLCTLFVFANPCHAAEGTLAVRGEPYTISTNTSKGSCTSVTRTIDNVTAEELVCADGVNEARMNSFEGCDGIRGLGSCRRGSPPISELFSTQLLCEDRMYNIALDVLDGECNYNGTGGDRTIRCSNRDDTYYVEASCRDGCSDMRGGHPLCCSTDLKGCTFGQWDDAQLKSLSPARGASVPKPPSGHKQPVPSN